MEYSSLSEKILRSIENIVNNDPALLDFVIFPTEDNTQNKSPVLYEEHHLGLESWCIKYVYQYVCHELFKIRKSLAEKKLSYSKMEDLTYLLMGGLFINPDVSTFWNMRRELLESDILNYDQELRFSKLVLTRKDKSNEAFSYRRWLLKRILEKMSKNGVAPPLSLLENELSVCSFTANNSQSNYHAWTHRTWCVEQFSLNFPELISRELEFSERWISEHVSENTGYHYRQFLIDKFKNNRGIPVLTHYFNQVIRQLNILSDGEAVQLIVFLLGNPAKTGSLEALTQHVNYVVLLLYEVLVVVENLRSYYIEHESLWLHRRYVLYSLVQVSHECLGESLLDAKNFNLPSKTLKNNSTNSSNKNMVSFVINHSHGEKQAKIFKTQPNRFESTNMYKILYDSENSFVGKNSVGSPFKVDLAKRYDKWLKYALGFELNVF